MRVATNNPKTMSRIKRAATSTLKQGGCTGLQPEIPFGTRDFECFLQREPRKNDP